ncbi:MAG: TonB-dependent receptor [bacterium]|nr:TonB-dependent receptor [bacterium]
MSKSKRSILYYLLTSTIILTSVAGGSAVGGTLKGLVLDHSGGEPLFGATVTVHPTGPTGKVTGTATDEDGSYELKNVSPGTYRVTVSFVGFTTERIEELVIREDGEEMLDAALIPRAINLNSISVTASRRPEKVVDAPASVSVVESEDIQSRTTLTPTEHLKGIPAVDVATTGLNQSNVVVRGFNNIFSGSLLALTDNRIARVPSLRFNAYNFIPTTNDDIERIEVVSGPGSALYGPNSASGVMHIVTKSPFGSEGTSISVGGGERDLALGSFRHAGNYNNRIGFKLSGQYYRGTDWNSSDPAEPDTIAQYRLSASGPDTISAPVANLRDFDIKKLAADARVDFLIHDHLSLIVNTGFNQGSSIELTGLGAAQAIDWQYMFYQARLKYKDLFIQGFVNTSDAGDTYLLQTGQMIVDKSRLWVAQIQHSYAPDDKWQFTYGIDALFTRPSTEATINGRNEQNDDIDEIGAYVQAETRITEQLRLVGAARLDDNNRLKDMVFSPRAAMVYQPHENHNLRFTYNRAYSTPDNNNLYLDILQKADVYGLGQNFGAPFAVDLRVQGVPQTGFHWRMGDEGPAFRSTFAPLDPLRDLTSSDYIEFNDPIFTNVMWGIGRGAVLAGVPLSLQPAVASVVPSTVSGVENFLRTLDPDTQDFVVTTNEDIADIERLKPTITQTFELGYKGVINNRWQFSVDAYRTNKFDFIGPLTVETPNVFLDPATLQTYLATEITQNYMNADPATQAALGALDQNSNGPIDELVAMFVTTSAGIPFGTATPEEILDPEAVLVTYRNFGDISFYGTDLALAYHLTRNWNVGATYSYISKNFFEKDAGQVHDINLNSPRHKFGVTAQFTHQDHALNIQGRFRFVDAFDMDSPFYGSQVHSYRVLDLNAGADIVSGLRFSLTIQNLLDEKHVEFVGAPEIGRLTVARLTQTF